MRSVCLLLTLSICAVLCGCKVAGVVAYKVMGPPHIQPKYDPPHEPMLVLVERYNAPGSSLVECETLAREIYRDLSEHGVAQQIDPIVAINLRTQNPEKYKAMTISQIGAYATAKQVLYVNVTSHVVDSVDGGAMIRGRMSGRVKVIDVATGQLRWPNDQADGYPVSAEIPVTHTRSGPSAAAVQASLVRDMAVATARMFYKWQPEYDIPPE